MTREQLKQFENEEVFINMEGTDENDWLDLINECLEAGIDLNERAEAYYSFRISSRLGRENVFGSTQPFIYYQREWNSEYSLLKCCKYSIPSIASYGTNKVLMLKVYDYKKENTPVFEV